MTRSSHRSKEFFHVPVGGGRCFIRIAAVLTSVQVRSVPVRPLVFTVRLLKVVVMFRRFAQEIGEGCDVTALCCRLPFASWSPHLRSEEHTSELQSPCN